MRDCITYLLELFYTNENVYTSLFAVFCKRFHFFIYFSTFSHVSIIITATTLLFYQAYRNIYGVIAIIQRHHDKKIKLPKFW